LRGSLYVFLGGCSYGVLSTFVKLAYGEGYTMGPVVFSQYLAGTILILLAVLAMRHKHEQNRSISTHSSPVPGKTTKKQRFQLVGVGAVVALTGIFYYAALQHISASLAILLLFQFTWIGVVLEAFLNRKWPSKGKVLALLFLIVGTILATGVMQNGPGDFSYVGVLFGFLAAVSHTFFIFFTGRVAPQVESMTRSLFMNLGALLFISVLFPPTFLLTDPLAWTLVKYSLLLGFFGPFLSTFLFTKGAPLTGPGLAAILGASELPTATVMASIFLGELVGVIQWSGILIILIGITLPEVLARMRRTRVTRSSVHL
jgi:drug/metabolite transporter (DMT)-like permease